MKHIIVALLSSIIITAVVEARTFIPRTSSLPPIANHNNHNIHREEIRSKVYNRNTNVHTNSHRNVGHTRICTHEDLERVLHISRGGSLTVEKQEDDDNIVLTKLRNIIRSMVDMGEKKSPITTKFLKLMIQCAEKVTGLDLLPAKKTKKKKKDRKKKIDGTSSSSSSSTITESKDTSTKGATAQPKSKTKSKPLSTSTSKTPKKQKPSNVGAAHAHISKTIKATNPNYRIQRELKEFLRSPPPNLSVKVGKNIRIWIITLTGTEGSLYENEKYRLRVTFPTDYPTSPPSVYFLQPTPRHEHVYTNGDICLSLLGKDWRPTMTAQSIANSILSILSGAGRKSLPMDNVAHAQNRPGGKQDDWVYHDDNC